MCAGVCRLESAHAEERVWWVDMARQGLGGQKPSYLFGYLRLGIPTPPQSQSIQGH